MPWDMPFDGDACRPSDGADPHLLQAGRERMKKVIHAMAHITGGGPWKCAALSSA